MTGTENEKNSLKDQRVAIFYLDSERHVSRKDAIYKGSQDDLSNFVTFGGRTFAIPTSRIVRLEARI